MNKECLIKKGFSDCNKCPVAADFALTRVMHSGEPNDKLRARFADANCPEGLVPVIMGNPDDLLKGVIIIKHGEFETDTGILGAGEAAL